MAMTSLDGTNLVAGTAEGSVLHSDVALSFWGGVDPATGIVIDQHHPLLGADIAGKIVAIPGSRGSCSGSGVLLELILNDRAPAAFVFTELDEIITLGVVIADVMFERTLPVIQLEKADFALLRDAESARLDNHTLTLTNNDTTVAAQAAGTNEYPETIDDAINPATTQKHQHQAAATLSLQPIDQEFLDGHYGKAAQVAMQISVRMAEIQGIDSFIDITQAHIDGCVYSGQSGLTFATMLADWGAKVRVPTTLNAISVDQRRWQQQGIDPAFGTPASKLGDEYVRMGAQRSFTCAPYLLESAPAEGEQIVWAESNAVVYANSVIGARTQKYADFLDICIALTGRAPNGGSHRDSERLPRVAINVQPLLPVDDAFWPLLGYHIGLIAVHDIPIIYGLENYQPNSDDLKAFSAAFATTSSASMYHMAGVTPEADKAHQHMQSLNPDAAMFAVKRADLVQSWKQLNTASNPVVDVVCLGNPHFSVTECAALAEYCANRHAHENTTVYVTMGRAMHDAASRQGYVEALEQFGVEFITDTCWCMLIEPVIPSAAKVLMTNSAKYAHYGPGLVGKALYFDSLANCVEAACAGHHHGEIPEWLTAESIRV